MDIVLRLESISDLHAVILHSSQTILQHYQQQHQVSPFLWNLLRQLIRMLAEYGQLVHFLRNTN